MGVNQITDRRLWPLLTSREIDLRFDFLIPNSDFYLFLTGIADCVAVGYERLDEILASHRLAKIIDPISLPLPRGGPRSRQAA